MSGTKGFSPYKHKFEEHHYKGISKLQVYYSKRLASSYEKLREYCREELEWLKEIKQRQFYTTSEKIRLNKMRDDYIMDRKELGPKFEGLNQPFGPTAPTI